MDVLQNMLLEEFNYVSVTAYQAMEDRARISSFYYLLPGVLASGLAAVYQFSDGARNIPLSLVALLLFIGSLCLAGALFFITEQPLSSTWASILAGAVFIIAVLVHIYYYRFSLSKESDTKTINNQVKVLESALNKDAE
jgi:hypothetical protein